MESEYVIETAGLTKVYNDRVVALTGVDLRVPRGATYGLVGPNGAGKTTLFRLLLGLQRPTAGHALVFGERMTPDAAALRRRIGFLATNPHFPPGETAIQYLRFVGEVAGLNHDEREKRVAALLRDFDLMGAAGQRIGTFSTGMTTRLGIAASFINDPDLVIWDEPTSGLDPVGRRQVIDLLKEMGSHRTVVVSTHVLGDVDRVCDEIGLLYRGRLIYSGPIEEMKRMARTNAVELEIEGDGELLLKVVSTWEPAINPEWDPPFFRVTLPDTLPLSEALGQLLSAVSTQRLKLLSVNMRADQLEEAFLERLEDDRRKGLGALWSTES